MLQHIKNYNKISSISRIAKSFLKSTQIASIKKIQLKIAQNCSIPQFARTSASSIYHVWLVKYQKALLVHKIFSKTNLTGILLIILKLHVVNLSTHSVWFGCQPISKSLSDLITASARFWFIDDRCWQMNYHKLHEHVITFLGLSSQGWWSLNSIFQIILFIAKLLNI